MAASKGNRHSPSDDDGSTSWNSSMRIRPKASSTMIDIAFGAPVKATMAIAAPMNMKLTTRVMRW